MWFSLFTTILILAVTFYQGIQGLFSALINCVLAILAAALAFGFYEDLYLAQLMVYQPDHGRAIALISIFVVSLLVMRTIVDQLIKNNLHFPIHLDRAGGGLFGFVTAMIIIGMLSIGFQMLPFGSTFLGFSRFSLVDQASGKEIINAAKSTSRSREDDSLKDAVFRNDVNWANVKVSYHGLWLNPDGFTVAVISQLSNNALAGRNRFADLNPDFLDYLHHMRDGLGREPLAAVGPGAISVKSYQYLRKDEPIYNKGKARDEKTGGDIVKYDLANRKPDAGRQWMAVLTAINEKSDKCQDRENLNFTSSQIRLLARDRRDGPIVTYPLVGINDSDPDNDHRILLVSPCQDIQYKRESASQMRLLFEVPDDSDFRPLYIQYKMNGRAEILPSQNETEPKAGKSDSTKKAPRPPDPEKEKAKPPKEDSNSGVKEPPPDNNGGKAGGDGGQSTATPSDDPPDRRGRIQGIRSRATGSYFGAELPFELTDYSTIGDLEIRNGVIQGGTGQLLAPMDDKEHVPLAGEKAAVKAFRVPEGKQLLHLGCEKLDPQSLLGKAIGVTVDKTQWPHVVDAEGGKYPAVGVYAIARVGGKKTLEVVYFDETAQAASVPPQLKKINANHLRQDDRYELYYLFLVPPGTTIVKLEASSRYHESLQDRQLIAPK